MSTWSWFLGFHEKVGDVPLKEVTEVVEDIGNQHENVEFGVKDSKAR